MIFRYGRTKIEIPNCYSYVYYATYIAGEWDFLKVKKYDIVLDAGAFIGDFTVKIARRAREVVAVEPLPWAFKILKENVEINGLKNVVLVNKALHSVEGIKVKMRDEGVGSKITNEGYIEIDTVKVSSLGKFNVIKMDIEGSEGEVFKDYDWLDHVRTLAIELHGERNILTIPNLLRSEGFEIREMTRRDLIKNTIRNVITHPLDFLRAEMKTKTLSKFLKKEYKVPAIDSNSVTEQVKIIYAKRLKTEIM